jgi:hypothetical protein
LIPVAPVEPVGPVGPVGPLGPIPFRFPEASKDAEKVKVSLICNVTFCSTRVFAPSSNAKVSETGAVSTLTTMMSLITRRVAAAGAATTVTGVAPLSTPSEEPSVKVVPVSSAQCEDQSGFVVAAAPDI